MSRVWGREETYRWPSDKPVWTITALALMVVAVLAAATHEYLREWTYFQQAYLGTYIGSAAVVEDHAVSGGVPDRGQTKAGGGEPRPE